MTCQSLHLSLLQQISLIYSITKARSLVNTVPIPILIDPGITQIFAYIHFSWRRRRIISQFGRRSRLSFVPHVAAVGDSLFYVKRDETKPYVNLQSQQLGRYSCSHPPFFEFTTSCEFHSLSPSSVGRCAPSWLSHPFFSKRTSTLPSSPHLTYNIQFITLLCPRDALCMEVYVVWEMWVLRLTSPLSSQASSSRSDQLN